MRAGDSRAIRLLCPPALASVSVYGTDSPETVAGAAYRRYRTLRGASRRNRPEFKYADDVLTRE